MAYEVDGNTIECGANGFLVNTADWTEAVAAVIAAEENIELTEKHWDVINYLRDEFLNNNGNQPNMRNMTKAMKDKWPDEKVDSKSLFMLFPKGPDKQAGRVAGLPESRRKGGY